MAFTNKGGIYRSQPNVKAPKVVIGYNEALDMGEFVNDIGNNLAWVTAKRGEDCLSQQECHEEK